MYIAMNRFQIVTGKEKIFEQLWKNRETYLESVKGFKSFNLIKGAANETFTLYASHSTWSSKHAFTNWTKSEAFRKAHKNAGSNRNIYIGHPKFEGFEVII